MEIVALFCDIDDFCLQFESAWHQQLVTEGKASPFPTSRVGLSEVMTQGNCASLSVKTEELSEVGNGPTGLLALHFQGAFARIAP